MRRRIVLPVVTLRKAHVASELAALLSRVETSTGFRLVQALLGLGDDLDVSALEAAFGSRNLGDLAALLDWTPRDWLAGALDLDILLTLMTDAAPLTASNFSVPLVAPPLVRLDFALTQQLLTHQALIATTMAATLALLPTVVESWGLTSAQAAALTQSMVGLTPAQVKTLDRLATSLVADGETGQHLADLLFMRVRAMLAQRAATIAQTVLMTLINDAQRLTVDDVITQNGLVRERVQRYWVLGDAPCLVCAPIPALNPDGRGIDEPFALADGGTIDGPLVHPNCYCILSYEEP